MMKWILFLTMAIICLPFLSNCGEMDKEDKILIMPRRLVEFAEKNGYTQVDDFYRIRGDAEMNPCFANGYISDDDNPDTLLKVVFLCQKIGAEDKWDCDLIITSLKYGNLLFDEIINNVLMGGVSFIKDTAATLDEFHYFANDNQQSGPEGIHLTHEVIRIDNNDGLIEDYYKYRGQWLIRTWD